MIKFPKSAAAFIAFITLCGVMTFRYALLHFQGNDALRFVSLLAVALVAARLKLKLPGLNGNMSVNLPFIILGVIELGLLQTLVIACVSTLVQSWKKRPQWHQLACNFFNMALSVGVAYYTFHHAIHESRFFTAALRIGLCAVILFLANTVPVSAIIALTELKGLAVVWYEIFLWSFPYYVLSAGVASVFSTVDKHLGWEIPLLILPLMFGIYHSYRSYFRTRSEELSPLATIH